MTGVLSRSGVRLSVAPLAAVLAGTWLGASLLLPLPPWRVERTLAAEEEQVGRAARSPKAVPEWSMNVGSPRQTAALGRGWSLHETTTDGTRRSFVWIDGPRADVTFTAGDWRQAVVTFVAFPLPELAPLGVGVEVDGEPRGTVTVPPGWTTTTVAIGGVAAGSHTLTLIPARLGSPEGEARALALAVDGLAVGPQPVDDPVRDRGLFAGSWRVGLGDRPALFTSEGAESAVALEGTRLRTADGLNVTYAVSGAAGGRFTALLDSVQGLAAAALLVLLPGLAWSRRRGPARLVEALAVSTGVLIAAFVVLRLVSWAGAPSALAAVLVGATGVAIAFRRPPALDVPWHLVLPASVSLVAVGYFATAVVPPLEDQDMELQATVHALVHDLRPRALTNRGTTYFFAHPPLLHLWDAGAFVLAGRAGRLADHDLAARKAAPSAPSAGDAALAARPHYEAWKTLLRRFLTEPNLWPTRQVNVLLSGIAVGLLSLLAGRLSGSSTLGLVLALVWLTLPEFLVRGGYGGYFAATAALSLAVLAVIDEDPKASMVGAALAFLANQKALLVPGAWVLAAPAGPWRRRFLPAVGATIGIAVFTAYGLAVDGPAFRFDFLQEHVLRRLDPRHLRFTHDAARWYPSAGELWAEFAGSYGLALTVLGGAATVWSLRRRPTARAAALAVVVGALVFTWTDWRQTKHLALLVPFALVCLAESWPSDPRWRRIGLALLLAIATRNVHASWPLLTDFEALRPSTTW